MHILVHSLDAVELTSPRLPNSKSDISDAVSECLLCNGHVAENGFVGVVLADRPELLQLVHNNALCSIRVDIARDPWCW